MKNKEANSAGKQANETKAGTAFMDLLIGEIRGAVEALMAEEVTRMCGQMRRPHKDAGVRRAGSEQGLCFAFGRRLDVKRPRVRGKGPGGKEQEVGLASYEAARSTRNVEREVVGQLRGGMTLRGQSREGGAVSKSEASRMFAQAAAAVVREVRGRPLGAEQWLAVMVDGVWLGDGVVVLVALGITLDGRKVVADFEVGSGEDRPTVLRLLERMRSRGFGPMPGHQLLAVLDGAKALRNGVLEVWPGSLIQRCLVHVERNLHSYLRKGDQPECSRLMQRVRRSEGAIAGREALEALKSYVGKRSAQAKENLEELGDDAIRVHLLEVNSLLHTTFLSTNAIENVMRNYRSMTGRVKRWRTQTDQVERWSACALVQAEKGFRRIKGHERLDSLANALRKGPMATGEAAASVPDGTAPSGTASASPVAIAA